MEPTGGDVAAFLDRVVPAVRRRDAETLVALMRRATGREPTLWGTIVGFGSYHYEYASGRRGDASAAGFAPRKAATVVYLVDGVGAHAKALARLGPHRTGVGCLYITDLERIDLDVLEEIVSASYRTLTAGTYGLRAREGGATPA
ncbi:DUF1801 domain-containing protein [Propionicicella superfundia]|uniref:DUF1801 domain-containing protein n=1 Tax=Propionicicella superfundia TaxID=348582 RepID=UPI00041243E4|nr:DUF1801 domain-containing protein [Propionicicella superfundia]